MATRMSDTDDAIREVKIVKREKKTRQGSANAVPLFFKQKSGDPVWQEEQVWGLRNVKLSVCILLRIILYCTCLI